MIKPEIIAEDQDLWVINKPPGLVVNRSKTIQEETLQDWLEEQLPADQTDWQELVPPDFDDQYGTPQKIFQQRLGLVHRLDRETSGVLVLAKNPGALVNLLQQFKDRSTQKHYLCLAHGNFRVPRGNIRAPIDRAHYDRQKMAVHPGGRPAVTQYQVKSYYPGLKPSVIAKLFNKEEQRQLSLYQGFSLVDCWPKTGRTHQIRVHLKHWRHPLVGDTKYVGRKRSRLDPIWCPRQFLHALSLTLTHPRMGKEVTYEAPLSSDLQQVLSYLEAVGN